MAAAGEQSGAAPKSRDAAQSLFATLSGAARDAEVLALYGERWGDVAALDAYFYPTASEPYAAISAAQRAQDEKAPLAETLAHWRKRLEFQREQGYASAGFAMNEARYFALAGERVTAVQALTRAIDLGIRDPLLGRDPAFAALRDGPDFKAQVTRMIALINIERAKLDMAPLP